MLCIVWIFWKAIETSERARERNEVRVRGAEREKGRKWRTVAGNGDEPRLGRCRLPLVHQCIGSDFYGDGQQACAGRTRIRDEREI